MEGPAVWTVQGNDYHLGAGESVKKLPNAILKVVKHMMTGELFLTYVQEKFQLPAKIYDTDVQLLNQAKTFYESDLMTKNLGILLAGVKGSGKTITSKILCNTLNLPVILVTAAHPTLPLFLNDIKQDVLIFVDEYEKVFAAPNESMLLTLMDGAMENGFKRVFLLTINELHVSPNLLERPGRIRYFKKYEDMNAASIKMVLNDMLIHKELYDETFKFVTELKTITIDIMKSVIDEVNLFQVSPYTFANIFNVQFEPPYADVFEVLDMEKKDMKLAEPFVVMPNYSKATGQQYIRVNFATWLLTRVINSRTIEATSSDGKSKKCIFHYVERKKLHRAFDTAKPNNTEDPFAEDVTVSSVKTSSDVDDLFDVSGSWEQN